MDWEQIVTPELLSKANACKTSEELLVLAGTAGMELTQEQAAEYFAKLHQTGELSDQELDNVTGGGCGKGGPKSGDACSRCGSTNTTYQSVTYKKGYLICNSCGAKVEIYLSGPLII